MRIRLHVFGMTVRCTRDHEITDDEVLLIYL